jgi:hypothetical protein
VGGYVRRDAEVGIMIRTWVRNQNSLPDCVGLLNDTIDGVCIPIALAFKKNVEGVMVMNHVS